MLVLGAPHLVVERLELLLAGGVDWADVEAGRALRGGRSQYHSPAQPRPPAEAPASGGGGGGHEPSLANRGMRGGFRSSNSPGLAWSWSWSKQAKQARRRVAVAWQAQHRRRPGTNERVAPVDGTTRHTGQIHLLWWAVCYQQIY
jgi:hypothetical protein